MMNEQNDENNVLSEENISIASQDPVVQKHCSKDDLKDKMEEYHEETGKYPVWRGEVTSSFKKWLKGEKIYDKDKERISLYVEKDTKEKWDDFRKHHDISTVSKLIRNSVNQYVDQESKFGPKDPSRIDLGVLSNISHELKQPLTNIKGFAQLLLEDSSKEELSERALKIAKNIFDSSLLLEKKIVNFLDNIKVENEQFDLLLIEDDLATIQLITSFFKNKGFSVRGVISASRGREELKNGTPKVILLDVILPDENGYELCKDLKSKKEFQDVPIFILTAIPASEVEEKLDEIGADGYILKPFDFSDFDKILDLLSWILNLWLENH